MIFELNLYSKTSSFKNKFTVFNNLREQALWAVNGFELLRAIFFVDLFYFCLLPGTDLVSCKPQDISEEFTDWIRVRFVPLAHSVELRCPGLSARWRSLAAASPESASSVSVSLRSAVAQPSVPNARETPRYPLVASVQANTGFWIYRRIKKIEIESLFAHPTVSVWFGVCFLRAPQTIAIALLSGSVRVELPFVGRFMLLCHCVEALMLHAVDNVMSISNYLSSGCGPQSYVAFLTRETPLELLVGAIARHLQSLRVQCRAHEPRAQLKSTSDLEE